MADRLARYRGALLGLAAGDALGTTLEFRQPGSFEPLSDIVGGGPFNLLPGQWTDDTSMALCLAESVIEKRGMDLHDQISRYVRWYRDGHLSSTGVCFDIGATTVRALNRYRREHNPRAGSTDAYSAGNGSIMRLAPVPLFFAANPRKAMDESAESSRTTHQADTCIAACRYLGGLLVGAVHGEDKATLLSARYTPAPGYWQDHPLPPEIDEIAAGSFKTRNPPQIQGSGWVVRSLEAALWAFFHSDTFRDGALLAVDLGDDADTTGAVYGQLAGAYYGASGIPSSWRDTLALRDTIERYAERLADLSVRRTNSVRRPNSAESGR